VICGDGLVAGTTAWWDPERAPSPAPGGRKMASA
jgi:hypothetical protein